MASVCVTRSEVWSINKALRISAAIGESTSDNICSRSDGMTLCAVKLIRPFVTASPCGLMVKVLVF